MEQKIQLGQSTSENINCLDTFRWFCNLELFVTNSSKRGSSACEGSVEFKNYTFIQHFTMYHSFRLAIPSIIFALMINERNGIFLTFCFAFCPHLAIGDNLLEESRQEICLLHYPAFLNHALSHPCSRCSKFEMSQMFTMLNMFTMFNCSSVLCPSSCQALHLQPLSL